ELKRVSGLRFEVAVFTNLTRDHLDLHKDMRSYFLAKKKLFTGLDGTIPRILVLNVDDPYFEELKAIAPSRVISYGMNAAADVHPLRYDAMRSAEGMEALLKTPLGEIQIRSILLGKPNLYNICAAVGVAAGLGLSAEAIRTGIAGMATVPGRF